MKLVPPRPVRRLLAGLTPIVLLVAALPLLAPTCGTFSPGVKSFSRSSLIIPMDVCYQCMTDGDSTTSPGACGGTGYVTPTGAAFTGGIACPQATDAGDVIKAYGLVYQLIRNGVAVYWSIEPSKTKLDAEDFAITYNSGPPAVLYDWANGGSGAAVTSQSTVRYRGGPFIVDGSDYDKASQILQQYKSTFGAVNVHVANVAFQAPVARTMAGGWSAGGAIPPKLAMLDIGSSGAGTKNSEVVIRGYLIKAGLDFVGAGGTSAAGQHGQIYDRLTMADFLPSTPGDWTTTRLYQNGYQILWVPHWAAPSSCSDCTTSASTGSGTCPTTSCSCSNKYSAADVTTALTTIGSFSAAGKDVFAECAGLGSFEGVNTGTPPAIDGTNSTYGLGDASTHFHTVVASPLTGGVWINKSVSNTATFQGGFASPFMQMGDFVFEPYTGAVQNFRPTTYKSGVSRFLSETNDPAFDIFTVRTAVAGSYGTSVYLGGHSYSGCDGTFQAAGTRLVLNTLFNLGASCVESGVTCSTGELGVCARGAMTCSGDTAVCVRQVDPSAEICNGLDDDCNGLVDDLPVQTCFGADPAFKNVGICREGVKSCVKLPDGTYGFTACQGEVLPSASEVCNGLDDDCDGTVDEGLTQGCYLGPSSSLDPVSGLPMGQCRAGVQACAGGIWGSCRVCTEAEAATPCTPSDRLITPLPSHCQCQVIPTVEYCGDANTGNGLDENCNGQLDETCGCTNGTTQPCYGGSAGTAGVGICRAGVQTCVSNAWDACRVCTATEAATPCTAADKLIVPLPAHCQCQVVPTPEVCGDALDQDCNGTTNDPSICSVCPDPKQGCYEGPAGTLGVGVCAAGQRVCSLGVFGACGGTSPEGTVFLPQVLPSAEICDGLDNDCDGAPDDGAACAGGFECVNGFCIADYCDPAEPAIIEGYVCDEATSRYLLANCGTTGAPCAAGRQCVDGTCIDPCASITCGPGSTCGGGQCTGGSCYSEGCGSGLVCRNGSCVVDPCESVYCPSGTFCREGDCVQACTFVSCGEGQRCSIDGYCAADACASVTCSAGKICDGGACVTDPCLGISCGSGQFCEDGICVDDPCATIDCPVGVCWRGQCYSTANPTGAGEAPPDSDEDAGGCGCTSGTPNPAALLLGLLALPLARRRREPRRGPGLLAILLVAGLTGTLAGCPKTEEETPAPIDILTDASNCGQMGNACDPGEICVDGFCGPGSPVAPFITSLTPATAAKGTTAPVTLSVTGSRFQSGAVLRVTTPTEVLSIPATFVDAQHLTATLDISASPEGSLLVRVRNPDLVRSNAATFVINLESPVVTGITPATVEAGKVTTLHASGTGLNATSQCHVKSTTFTDTALPSALAAGGLDCTLDATAIPPGNYKVWVRNEGNLNSAEFALVVTSTASFAVTSLSPSSGKGGEVIGLTVSGTGFDTSCRILFAGSSQTTTFLDPTALFAQVPLTDEYSAPLGNGTYAVGVQCGTTTSTTLPFTVTDTAPTVTQVSPQTAYQGEAGKDVTFIGANLPSGTGLAAQIRLLDGTWLNFGATSWTSATELHGTLNVTPVASWPAGEYQVRVKFPDASTSATFPFRILSNAATLHGVAPAGGKQGDNLASLAVTGSNFFSGITFSLRTSAGADVVPSIPVISWTGTSASIGPLSLASRDNGAYQIVAINTGAAPSNALSFSISPGPPTISSLAPAQATQSDTPTTVTLTGVNFAKPDATGAGGSMVYIQNVGLQIPADPDGAGPLPQPWLPLPSTQVTVVSNTSITVTLDTRSVVPSSTQPYSVQVWNPGGDPPPQKSNTQSFTVLP